MAHANKAKTRNAFAVFLHNVVNISCVNFVSLSILNHVYYAFPVFDVSCILLLVFCMMNFYFVEHLLSVVNSKTERKAEDCLFSFFFTNLFFFLYKLVLTRDNIFSRGEKLASIVSLNSNTIQYLDYRTKSTRMWFQKLIDIMYFPPKRILCVAS